jgi:hypothetical protein
MDLIIAYYIDELQNNKALSEKTRQDFEANLFRYFDIIIKRKTNNWTFNENI